MSLQGKVALVAGATRGAGRGIAVELGTARATVYVTGRTTRDQQSEYGRPETIEETAELVSQAGGRGLAVPVDHLVAEEVRDLINRIRAEEGRLDILVNDIWGGEKLFEWNKPVWEHERETPITARPEGPQTTEKESEMTQNIRAGDVNDLSFINPKGLYDPAPNGYSHLAVFPADWRMILPAGQGGETEDQVLSDDFRTQLKQAVRNTEIVLAAAGAKLSDVAKFTLYVVDHDKEKFRIIQEEFGPVWGDRKPAWTLAPVPALALEGMLVEIDVIAVVPR